MPFKIKKDGAWVTPAAGTIKVKTSATDTSWKEALSIKVKVGGAWVDSGYVSYPNAPTNLRLTSSVGDGDNRNLTFGWDAPVGGAPVTRYEMTVYNSSDVQIGSAISVTSGTSQSYAFPEVSSPTIYYVRIKSVYVPSGGSPLYSQTFGTNSSGGYRLKVTIGAKTVPPVPYWGSPYLSTPIFPLYGGQSNTVYNNGESWGGYAFDGNYGTHWSGSSWSWSGGEDWIAFLTPDNWTGLNTKRLYGVTWWPDGNAPAYYSFELSYNGGWILQKDGSGSGVSPFGNQTLTLDSPLDISSQLFFRVRYSNLGYNPVPEWGDYRVMIKELSLSISDLLFTPGSSAGANSVINA